MKHIAKASILSVFLSACSTGMPGMSVGVGIGTGIGSHVGLGTSLTIPIRTNQTAQANSGLPEQTAVIHFDAQGEVSDNAVKGGYSRRLLNKRNQDYIVQDFYTNGNKRTDPYTLKRAQLLNFRSLPENGSVTTYTRDGRVISQQVFQNGKVIRP